MSYDVSQTLRKDVATGKVTLAGTTKAVLDDSRIGPHGGQLAVNGAHNPATLDLDFANGRYHLDDGGPAEITDPASILSVTRASTKMVTGPNGKLREVPIDTLAREFDPLTGEPRGVSIEESRTNLLLWSEDFTNAVWSSENSSVTANQATAPDGTSTVDLLVENTNQSQHAVRVVSFGVNNVVHTESIYVKRAAGARNAGLRLEGNAGVNAAAAFDLGSGNVISQNNGAGSIEALSDGWHRISLTPDSPDEDGSLAQVKVSLTDGDGDLVYTGDGTSGIYIWGAQLEEASTPSSYIPTTSAAATRAADSVSRVLGEEFNNDEGTVFCGLSTLEDGSAVSISNGTYSDMVNLRANTDSSRWLLESRYAGTTDFTLAGSYSAFGEPENAKVAYSWKGGIGTFVVNGSLVGTAAITQFPSVDRINVGINGNNNSGWLNGTDRRIRYAPHALTEQELIELTS